MSTNAPINHEEISSNFPYEETMTILENYEHINIGMVYSTWALETGYGTSDLWINSNNAGGITQGSTYASYTTKLEGIRAVIELLDTYYQNGLTTIEQVRNRWSEADDTSDIVWIWNSILN